jgi:hypothetical protein
MRDNIQALSIDGNTATLDYDDCTVVMDVSNLRGIMEVELTPEYDLDYKEFSHEMYLSCLQFTEDYEDAQVICDEGHATVVSMRLSTLRDFGGDLTNQLDSRRFDSGHRSRKFSATKERRGYRPWQSARQRDLIGRLFN